MLQFSFPLLFSQDNVSQFSFSNICGHFVKYQPVLMGLMKNGREQGNLDSQPIFVKPSQGPFCCGGQGTGEDKPAYSWPWQGVRVLFCLTVLFSIFLNGFLNFPSKQSLGNYWSVGASACMSSWLSMLVSREPSSWLISTEPEMKQSPQRCFFQVFFSPF